MFVCCEYCVLSCRGLCDELITRPEESYRLCCVVVCDLETSRMGASYIYDISRLRVKRLLYDVMGIKFPVSQNLVPVQYCLKQCSPNFFDGGPLFALTITMDSHILAHTSIQCQADRDPKSKMFTLELILDSL